MRIRRPVDIRDEHFEGIITELEALRTEENRLARLYPRIQLGPRLRERFLMDLAALAARADHLDAVLDPNPQFRERDAAQTNGARGGQLCA